MNRRSFFGNLLGGTAAVAIAPLNALGRIVEEASVSEYVDFLGYNLLIGLDGWLLGAANTTSIRLDREFEYVISNQEQRVNILPTISTSIDFEELKEASDFPGLLDIFKAKTMLKAWYKDQHSGIHSFDRVYLTDLTLTAGCSEVPVNVSGRLCGTGEILFDDKPKLKQPCTAILPKLG
jgi:hypothetical protein